MTGEIEILITPGDQVQVDLARLVDVVVGQVSGDAERKRLISFLQINDNREQFVWFDARSCGLMWPVTVRGSIGRRGDG